ncbi:lipopolysaccharide biosynthesis protein [Sphingomonas japonica]|uniref:PST family polysaccharide transporter n=1 Tax=Sphingomonas japonica TaxID=511662 RepID=A0ABX0U3J6_9SPHN|nr:lipopolysaccharide biosynthesis protein [Sphingomonas japonica]NIJ25154.1 PST family polysaccharide transporter [Sphingomonas japonica]
MNVPSGKSQDHAKETLTKRTMHGFVWQFLGTGSEAAARMIVLIVLVWLLTPAEFGLATAAQIIIGFTRVVSQVGMGPALVQRERIGDDHIKSVFAVSLYIGLVAVAILYLLAPLLADAFDQARLTGMIRVLAIYLPIANLAIVSESLILRDLQFKRLATAEFASFALGYGAVGVGLAWAGFGAWSLIVALLAQSIMRTVLLWLQRPPLITLRVRRRPFSELFHFGAGQSLAHIASYAALTIDNVVVGVSMGSVALGLYGRAYQFLTVPSTLFGRVADRVLFPAMSSIQNDVARLQFAYERALGLVAMITMPLSGLLILLAPEIVSVLLGTRWQGMVLPFQLLAVALCFRTGYKICDSLTRARGSVYRRAWRQWVYALAVFVGASLGGHWGLPGIAAGVSVAITLNFLMMAHLGIKVISGSWTRLFSIHLRHLVATIIALAPTTVIVLWLRANRYPDAETLGIGCGGIGLTWFALFLLAGGLFSSEGRWVKTMVFGRLKSIRKSNA